MFCCIHVCLYYACKCLRDIMHIFAMIFTCHISWIYVFNSQNFTIYFLREQIISKHNWLNCYMYTHLQETFKWRYTCTSSCTKMVWHKFHHRGGLYRITQDIVTWYSHMSNWIFVLMNGYYNMNKYTFIYNSQLLSMNVNKRRGKSYIM